MLNILNPVPPTPATSTDFSNITQLIKYLKQNKHVYIVGPDGTGKTFLIKQAIGSIENELNKKCYYFDISKLINHEGGLNLYKTIIFNLTGQEIELDENTERISNQFVQLLDEKVKMPIVLFFDHFKTSHKEFFHFFSETCRLIGSCAYTSPNSGCNNIIMVFASTFIQYEDADLTKSPLWNITEKITVSPHLKIESERNNSIRLNFIKESEFNIKLSTIIHEITHGHKYLSTIVIQIIVAYNLFDKDKETILQQCIKHIWNVMQSKKSELGFENQKIHSHFFYIIEYLENNSEILKVILDLSENKVVVAEYPDSIDQVTITGLVNKDNKGQYHFSNIIYQNFIHKLLKNHRTGDYCLFHAEKDELWDRAIDTYKKLYQNNSTRNFSEMMVSTIKQPSAHITFQILQRLRKYDRLEDIVCNISEVLTLMYNISEWSLFEYNESTKQFQLDHYFKPIFCWEKRVPDNKAIHIFLKNVLKANKYLVDWTGRWEAIPINIGSKFRRIFVSRISPGREGWGNIIVTFINESLMLYHNLIEQKKTKKKILELENSLSVSVTPSVKNTRIEQMLWNFSKQKFERLGIARFILHEILGYKRVRMSNSSQAYLTTFKEDQKLSDSCDLAQIFNENLNLKPGMIFHIPSNNDQQFIGCNMATHGNMIVIQIKMSSKQYEQIKEVLYDNFELIYNALELNHVIYNNTLFLDAVKNILEYRNEYIYIISHTRDILFINKKLSTTMEMDNYTQLKLNKLKYIKQIYDKDKINLVFENNQPFYSELNFQLKNKNFSTYANYLPLTRDNVVFAVAVIMQESNYTHQLLSGYRVLAEKQTIKEVEKELFRQFCNLGFDVIEPYLKDEIESDLFFAKSMGRRKIEYRLNDNDTNMGKISIWYRKGSQSKQLIESWKKRYKNTLFFKRLKEDTFWREYTIKKNHRPRFWITVPILFQNEVVRLFAIGFRDEQKWEDKILNYSLLSQLETFAMIASRTIENIKQFEFLQKFHAILSHGLKEPIQTARMFLDAINIVNSNERAEMVDTVDANLEMILNSLESLLTLRSRVEKFEKKDVNLTELILKQTRIFRAYARKKSNISFQLNNLEHHVYGYANETLLIQVLNNLVGNSIKYLKNANISDRNKIVKIQLFKKTGYTIIQISDNGTGLPADILDYLKQSFFSNQIPLTSQFGIGFSREILKMIDAQLVLIEKPELGYGTTFQIILPERQI